MLLIGAPLFVLGPWLFVDGPYGYLSPGAWGTGLMAGGSGVLLGDVIRRRRCGTRAPERSRSDSLS
ncbi:MAG: hypothetical protein OXB99_09630 [Acidimicrobiaceae bacterium]|nr:hypothetical protein [Acidimicrobiaceae bacterium]